ncbi:MAG: AbrB/MazE/SpoVT family DNA-binding domain-containing protein [Deltaproteobacteria bacterium]|nr:AbrB/MazE/SpoVT family DNA-binding domain-containing protein [Deltaproteobacteria bacterium]
MRQNLTVSSKGQITLPAGLRKKLGIQTGDTVIAEEKNGELVLRPAAVVEIEIYSDDQIDRWDNEDRLDTETRKRILEKIGQKP